MHNTRVIDNSDGYGGGFGGAAMGMWAFIIFVILIIFFVFHRRDGHENHGNYGHFGGYPAPYMAYAYPHGKECGPSNCQLEIREILDAKQTQLDLCKDTARVIESNNKGYETILAKMSNDALVASTAKNVEQANVISELKQTIATNAHFGAITKELDWIKCKMLQKPEVHGVGTVCPPEAILRGFREERRDDCGCRG